MTAWQCRCGWEGFNPSFSDASELRPTTDGTLAMDRTHVPVCPRCFAEVQTVREAARRELTQVLIGIGRLA
jgi:hypothetical protein